MNLTRDQIELIRETFELLRPEMEDASELLYVRLFEIAPELRSMFRADISEQGMRFMSTLEVVVRYLDDPEALRPHLELLAKGHAAYGVKPEHFQPMGVALLWSIQDPLGDKFPAGADAACEVAYDHMAREMVQLAG